MTNPQYPELHLLVAGRWIAAAERETLAVHNPSTGDVLGALPRATPADLDAAVEASARGFEVWRRRSPHERAAVLRRAAEHIRRDRDLIVRLIGLELGKPVAEARVEVESSAELFEWAADEARRSYGRVIPAREAGFQQTVVREPLGPVAAFSGWNAPAQTPSRKLSGALAAGCSVIIKPSEETPATALVLARALQEAGLPDGVLNVVFGDPAEISRHLLGAPGIAALTFTGSTPVGRQLAQLAGAQLKHTILELGGHAPVVVFADADPGAVARSAVAAAFRNSGQICTSPNRFYVHADVHDEFVATFAELAKGWVVGDPADPGVQMGPLANTRRLDAMAELVDDAARRGAVVASGGSRIDRPGWFWSPTLLVDVPLDAMVSNVEPFGPVAAVAPFRTFEEAVTLANRVPFGLAAYGFTNDGATAHAFGDAIESGAVAINHWRVSLPETPFGGFHDSGTGLEGGREGLEEFQRVKYVSTKWGAPATGGPSPTGRPTD